MTAIATTSSPFSTRHHAGSASPPFAIWIARDPDARDGEAMEGRDRGPAEARGPKRGDERRALQEQEHALAPFWTAGPPAVKKERDDDQAPARSRSCGSPAGGATARPGTSGPDLTSTSAAILVPGPVVSRPAADGPAPGSLHVLRGTACPRRGTRASSSSSSLFLREQEEDQRRRRARSRRSRRCTPSLAPSRNDDLRRGDDLARVLRILLGDRLRARERLRELALRRCR